MTDLLQNVRLFEAFSATDRTNLLRFMHEKRFEPGAPVCTRGDHGGTMLVVAQGALAAVIAGKDTPQHEIAQFEPGAVIGEMFCIDPAPRPATIIAQTATVVLELGRDDLTKMRQDAPATAAALVAAVFREVLRRLRCLDDRLEREVSARYDEDAHRLPTEDVPAPWHACFAHLRGSA